MQGTVIYAPATFEERGVAVSFTTPLLSQTRVRVDERRRLEVLIPSFSEGKGIYVVPWKVVPEMVAMTVHDRYLHEQIVRLGACSPQEIRGAQLRAARSGLAGPEGAKAARATLADDQKYRALTNVLLIVEVLRAAGLESADLVRSGLDSREMEALTRSYLTRAAASFAIDPAQLYERIATLAEVVWPIGLVTAPEPGRLRRRLRGLADFRDELNQWADEHPCDAAPVARFCASVATHTLSKGEELLADFDRRARAIGTMIRDWASQSAIFREDSEKLTWLADGWDFILGAWAEAQGHDDLQEQAMTVNEIFRILPLLPTRETARDQHAEARSVMAQHRRSVRAYEDWRTGVLDTEAVHRIEAIKAKAA